MHEITVTQADTLGPNAWFRAVCSCGKYRSGLHARHARALAAGHDHVKAASTPPARIPED